MLKLAKKKDFLYKIDSIRKLMNNAGCSAVLISSQSNFTWLTGGRSFIGLASDAACAAILVTVGGTFLIVNNIEKQRFIEEELSHLDEEIQVEVFPWYSDAKKSEIIRNIVGVGSLETDISLHKEFSFLRRQLTDYEIENYRWLGQKTAAIVEKICYQLRPGISEYEVSGLLSSELWRVGIEPITNLISFDDRVYKYRHPLPTENILKKYAMLAVCTRRGGLVISLSRFVHFGTISWELKEKHKAVTSVDTCMINSTRPGVQVGDIFDKAINVYAETGYGEEWKLHHQGGPTGYLAREYRVVTESNEIVKSKQAFAWNPSITGIKSEDTILVLEEGNEILTHSGGYSYTKSEFDGKTILRPSILEL